jgi:hypothetical protein
VVIDLEKLQLYTVIIFNLGVFYEALVSARESE